VLRSHRDSFEVFALTGRSRMDVLARQCVEFKPRFAVVPSEVEKNQLISLVLSVSSASIATEIIVGEHALIEVSQAPEVDMVMSAIVGAAGLLPTLAAAKAGKRLLLANKEALVVGGEFVMQAARDSGIEVMPIDSEHSAIFQCLPTERGSWQRDVARLVLTASGGPFLRADLASLAQVTPAQAVAHPNWVMGRKISVDSATMMNKALEVIEAHYLFGFAANKIDVLVHPQSIVHSMVEMTDGSVMAQLGTPDMRTPIAVGLAHPARMHVDSPRLNFLTTKPLEFLELDPQRFPCLQLAYDALAGQAGASAVLNAANEVAVDLFLNGALRYTDIYRLCHSTLSGLHWSAPVQLSDVIALDEQARAFATQLAKSLR
jgi:1-deoxy-D-xylulose-5-phosphate reductoisomerase